MNLNILGWKCEGLRCPDFDVKISEKSSNSSTFFQMPNGTGKTTTLRLLKRSLYNHEFKSSEIEEFKAKKKEEYKKEGFFEAKFSVDGKIFYTKINFDFENKIANYSSSLTDEGGYTVGFKLPSEIENIVDKELVDLLLVDLEIDVKPMFRDSQTKAQEAIRKFCKINLLESLINDFKNYKDKKRKESSQSGNVQSQINTEETRLKKIDNRINEIEKKINEFKKFLNDTEDEYLDGKKQLQDALQRDSQINKKRQDLEKKRDEIKFRYDEILTKNLNDIKNIGTYENNLSAEIKDFVNNLDEMGLPEEEVRIFFDKILKKTDCICGEKLTNEKKEIIKKAMESFISQEEAGIIGKIKDAVRKNTEEYDKVDLSKNSSLIQGLKQELDATNESIEIINNKALKDDRILSDTIKKLENDRNIKKEFIDITVNQDWKAKDNEDTQSLISLKEQKKRVEKKLAELSGTKEIEEKVLFLNAVIEEAIIASENEISKELTIECNKKIEEMLIKNPIYISSIDKHIVLEGQAEGSTGQEARIGIIFLLTILERSSIQFPLIVDTPVKGMDNAAKRRTARFISELKSQFICFVIDADKPNFTVEYIKIDEKNSNFITAFRRSNEFDKLSDGIEEKKISTNGQVVHGYKFFEKFTEEEDSV
jgi:DNA sulfur modification protein DndD